MSERMSPSTQVPETGSIIAGHAKFTGTFAGLSGSGAALDVIGSNRMTPTPPSQLLPMSEFDPSQPAILHDRRTDRIETWTGEEVADYTENSVARPDGTVEWSSFVFDGWDDVLGG